MTPTDAGGNDVSVEEVRVPTRADVVGRLLVIGAARRRALDDAAAALDDVVGTITDALERGADLNLTECARAAQVTKQTLYDRIPAALIGRRARSTPDTTEARP